MWVHALCENITTVVSTMVAPRLVTGAARKMEILEILNVFPELKCAEDDSGKSALHLAAWQGSPANVMCLLESNADIDQISRGPHNYGKSAVFYAITRDRDNIVQMLLKNSACPNIVNNKGQSVLSLAASHCTPETIDMIVESEMHHSAKPWTNYRVNHSDGMQYDDLDIRFVQNPTAVNVPMPTVPYSLRPSTRQSRKSNFSRNNPGIEGRRNVRDMLCWSDCTCMNENPDHPLQNVFMGNPALYLQSARGPELLIYVTFRHPVHITHINFVGNTDNAEFDGSAPKGVHLYVDCPRVDIHDISSFQPAETLDLHQGDVNPGRVTSLGTAGFLSVSSMAIFIFKNQAESQITSLNRLEFFANSEDTRNVTKRISKAKCRAKKTSEKHIAIDLDQLWESVKRSIKEVDKTIKTDSWETCWSNLLDSVVAEAGRNKMAPNLQPLAERMGFFLCETINDQEFKSQHDAYAALESAFLQVPRWPLEQSAEKSNKETSLQRRSARRACHVLCDGIRSVSSKLFAVVSLTVDTLLQATGHNLEIFEQLCIIHTFNGEPQLTTFLRIVDQSPSRESLCNLAKKYPQFAKAYSPDFSLIYSKSPECLHFWATVPEWQAGVLHALSAAANDGTMVELAAIGNIAWHIAVSYGCQLHAEPGYQNLVVACEAHLALEMHTRHESRRAAEYAAESAQLAPIYSAWVRSINIHSNSDDTEMETLEDTDVLKLHPAVTIRWIDTVDAALEFSQALLHKQNGDGEPHAQCDRVAVDCEWRHPRPISVVQLAVSNKTVFLLDFVGTTKECQKILCRTLRDIFASKHIQKVVFAFDGDWKRLRLLLGVEATISNVFDIQSHHMKNSSGKRGQLVSLKALVWKYLGRTLDKKVQRSNWDERPLSTEQLNYAALDALVLLSIIEELAG